MTTTTADLARLIPLLSGIDQDKGVSAVIDTLQALGVTRWDGERGRVIFRAVELSVEVLDNELRKRLG